MRRIGGLWSSVTDMGNLQEAAKRACGSRKDLQEVAGFCDNRESNLVRLQKSLLDGTYRSS